MQMTHMRMRVVAQCACAGRPKRAYTKLAGKKLLTYQKEVLGTGMGDRVQIDGEIGRPVLRSNRQQDR